VLGHAVEPPPDVRAVGRVEPNEPLPGLRKAVVFGDVVIPRRGPRARLWGGARVKVKGSEGFENVGRRKPNVRLALKGPFVRKTSYSAIPASQSAIL
jgi:hypothetical protein